MYKMIKVVLIFSSAIIYGGCQPNQFNVLAGRTKTGNDIQKLIDELPVHGGEIKLTKGVFFINQPLILKNNVWLHGEGRGTVLSVPDHIGIILEGLNGVRISDLTVKSDKRHIATSGIVVDNCVDCQVDNVLTQGFKDFGICLRNKSFLCELNSCRSADNMQANFYFEDLGQGGRVGDYVPNIVNSCLSYGGKYGFEFHKALVVNLTGCAVYQSLDYGFYLHSTSNSINISGCRSYQIGSDAVFIDSSREVNISSNIFCWHRGHGIVLSNSQWGTIASNNIIDNGVRTLDGSYRNGVVLKNETKGMLVSSNAIFNWGDQAPMEYGITEDKTCSNNLIANNNINYFTQQGIWSQGKGTLVDNNILKGDSAYVGMNRKPFPDFDTKRMDEFFKTK